MVQSSDRTDARPKAEYVLSPLFSWRGAIADSTLEPTTRHVALTLSLHMSERGDSCFPSQERLARETGLHIDTVRTHLRMLGAAGWLVKEVRRRGEQRGTRVYYTATVPTTVAQNTSGLTSTSQNPTTTGVDDHSERSSVRATEPPQPPVGGATKRRSRSRANAAPLTPLERCDDFALWWKVYPRQVGKIDAEKAWRDLLGRLPSIEQLCDSAAALRKQVYEQCAGQPGWEKYIPYPASWLRSGRFLDMEFDSVGTPTGPLRCAVCGVNDPCQAVCQGVESGMLGSVGDCVWRDRK